MNNSWTGKPELTVLTDIANDGFWVDLKMSDLVTWMRIPSEYDNDTIKRELIGSMIEVNRQLNPVKALLIINHASLSAYCTAHPELIGGMDVVVSKYQEAVFSYAKAVLLQQFKTMNRKAEAENMAKESRETESYWLNRSLQAVLFFFKKFGIDASTLDSINDVVVYAI